MDKILIKTYTRRPFYHGAILSSFLFIAVTSFLPQRANAVGDIYGSGGNMDAMFTLGATTYGPVLTTSGPFALSSELTDDSLDSKKIMAKDDAAAFFASAGRYRGAYLESLFHALREQASSSKQVDEYDIALWVLKTTP